MSWRFKLKRSYLVNNLILNMEGLQFFLLVTQIIIAVLLIILVLAQKSDGDSLSGMSAGANGLNSAISGRAGISILNKVTMALSALFMINCLVLASITNNKNKSISQDLNRVIEDHNQKTSANPASPPANNPESTKPNIPQVE